MKTKFPAVLAALALAGCTPADSDESGIEEEILPVATVGVIMYIEPASAVVWASLFLAESPPAAAWVGVGLVIAGGLMSVSEIAHEEVAGAALAL